MSVPKQKEFLTRGILVKKFILAIAVLNILDATLTWILISQNWAHEANPVPRILLTQGPLAFFLVKIGVVSGVLLYMSLRLTPKIAFKYFYVVLLILIGYSTINLLHISSFLFVLIS
jgi:hypothetical protein